VTAINLTIMSQNKNQAAIKTEADKVSYSIGMNIGQSILSEGKITSLSVEVLARAISDALKMNEADRTSYAIGMNIGESVKKQNMDQVNAQLLAQAIVDVIGVKTTLLTPDSASKVLEAYFTELNKKAGEKMSKEGKAFLEENKKRKGVNVTASGLQYEILVDGKGEKPKATDQVTCHYTGTLTDGKVFDSSVQRGQPLKIGVNQVIAGWTEALQLMGVGSKWKVFIPYNLGYGEQGTQGIPPYSTLIFEVELISIDK